MAARAFAAAGDDAAMAELHRAETALSRRDDSPSLSYWYDEAFLQGIRGQCLLRLGRPAEALALIEPAVSALDPTISVRNLAMTNIDLSATYLQLGEVEQAARTLSKSAHLAVRNRSVRLALRLRNARRELEPWKGTRVVTDLDEEMAGLRVLPGNDDDGI
jgi:tetratricopeptide (TPR) repeat protein